MPTDALKEFAEYERALATAEAREAKVRTKFDLYDADLSGDIDATEVTSLMDDLGLLRDLKSNVIEFVTTMFTKHDADDDGTLSFEEFRHFYNAALDDAQGRKPKPPVVARTVAGLSPEMVAARKKASEERAREKAQKAETIRRQNAELKARIKATNKGGDDKGLDERILEARRRKAADGRAAREAEEARYKASAKDLDAMKKNTAARTDDDVTDDVIGSVNIGAMRQQKAAEGRAAREAEEARYTQSAADLSRMKKEAVGRDDKGRW